MVFKIAAGIIGGTVTTLLLVGIGMVAYDAHQKIDDWDRKLLDIDNRIDALDNAIRTHC